MPIIDKIQLSGTVYTIGSDVTVDQSLDSGSTNPVENRVIYNKIDEVEQVTAAGLNVLNESKQDTLVSGTNIKTINNESILGSGNITIEGGSGGKAVNGGTNISITTGETADTINCTIPVSADTNHSYGVITNYSNTASNMSFAGGYITNAKMDYSFAFGMGAETNYYYSTAIGQYTKTTCWGETAFGCYNNSVSANTNFDGNSGNTLFSVGNGGYLAARHNALQIMQNGDIYIADTNDTSTTNYYEKPMIKLQDQLGGSSITVDTALDSGSTNPVENRVIYNKIDEVEQVTAAALNKLNDRLSEDEEVTAAGLNALNDNFGGLKLMKISQTDYENLQVKDQNTLYIVI